MHLAAKLLVSLLVVGTNVAILKYSIDALQRNDVFVWIAASVMQLISTVSQSHLAPHVTHTLSQVTLIMLVLMEHIRSAAPSTLVLCYSLLKCIFNGAALRTYVKIGTHSSPHTFVILMSISIASYFMLLSAEAIGKRRLLRDQVSTSNSRREYPINQSLGYSPCVNRKHSFATSVFLASAPPLVWWQEGFDDRGLRRDTR